MRHIKVFIIDVTFLSTIGNTPDQKSLDNLVDC